MAYRVQPLILLLVTVTSSSFLISDANNSVSLASTGKEKNLHSSINFMVSDDSGSGDRTYIISLAAASDDDGVWYNKSMVSMKVGDAIRVQDNGSFVLLNDERNYRNCDSTNPSHIFNSRDGNYTLHDSGSFYIISSSIDLCSDGAKTMIKVLARGSSFTKENPPHQIISPYSSSAPCSVFINMGGIGIVLVVALFLLSV